MPQLCEPHTFLRKSAETHSHTKTKEKKIKMLKNISETPLEYMTPVLNKKSCSSTMSRMQCFIQVISSVSSLHYSYGTSINMKWLDEVALFRGTLQMCANMLKDANWSWTSWNEGLSNNSPVMSLNNVKMLCVHAKGRDIFVHEVFSPDIKVNQPLLLWGSDCHWCQKPQMSGTGTTYYSCWFSS